MQIKTYNVVMKIKSAANPPYDWENFLIIINMGKNLTNREVF
ncbi:hypothetical protein CWATWH8502_843 [Crocosphaera watsonii WH 8502]|uniref:Uncharacterized protein n=5 Tax=Crocosphaera watsonii TaxID=263511 RepID=T2JS33_CROWT|nr:hypothetical protein CWATWH0003_1114 [Crocosphaera watsonii WH 0003]CCQ51129.1 hypothetical protein CWATWH8502_843 [Crocosphaera watsonii WH 8502]CCQ58128.1 hypothetical protein CWATWH0005_1375 [Crocosphaera watsonii WH 0005]CCQ61704.1 hypothetical protein CWATWH0401_526 [Crocosphaera watsonii WH 0401]CCQ67856.1 hypothetical protein CWATWH0402_1755 [Crocosphaera watsonii WH 0402]